MRILVTGGAGFIGSTIVDAYIQKGHKVWVLDNEQSGTRKQVNPQATFSKIDVCDRKKVSKFFKGKNFDVVNHHAAQMDVRISVLNPHYDAEVNIIGLLNLLEECRKSKVRKFIFSASGGTAYGECIRPAQEGDKERPLSPYGVSKLASEKYIQTYGSLYGMKYTVFRYANVYGPRQNPHGEAGVVAIFSNRILKNNKSILFGGGSQTRDFVYVGDVARANVLALTKGDNQILNIGTGKEVSVKRLYQELAKINNFKLIPIVKPGRSGELRRSVLSYGLAKQKLGWKPMIPIVQGLKLTFNYFRQRLETGQIR